MRSSAVTECECRITEYTTIGGKTTEKKHWCQKPKGHETMRYPLSLHACGCGHRWEKGEQ